MALVLNGLSIGMLLFLLAAGLTLVFGLLGVVNFAHGSLYMLGAYTAFQVVQWTGSFWLALLVAPILVGLAGALMERFALRPLYARDHSYQLLLTFGFILVIEEFIRMVWGVDFKAVSAPALLSGTTEVAGSVVTDYRLFIIVFGAVVSALLFYVIEKTRVGVVVRAASANSAMVSCLGIDVGKVRTGVFVAGAMLAAVSGVVGGAAAAAQAGNELFHHPRLLHRGRARRTWQHPGGDLRRPADRHVTRARPGVRGRPDLPADVRAADRDAHRAPGRPFQRAEATGMKRLLLLLVLLAAVPFVVKDQGILYFLTLIMVLCVFAIGYDIVFGVRRACSRSATPPSSASDPTFSRSS